MRAPALTGRYEFLSFRDGGSVARGGRNQGESSFGRIDAGRRREGQALGDGGLYLERPTGAGIGRGFARVFPDEFKQGMAARAEALGDNGPTRRKIGSAGSRALTCTPLRSFSRGTRRSMIDACPSTSNSSPHARGFEFCHRSISRPFRRSIMRTTISAIATGSRSRSSREAARSRRRAQERRSRLASSSWATPTRTESSRIVHSQRCSPATVVTWLTGGSRSTLGSFGSFCVSTARVRRSRS